MQRVLERASREPSRSAVVWFGEPIAQKDMDAVGRFIDRTPCGELIFIAAGTSGLVTPASALVEDAKRRAATTWLVNLERAAKADYFDRFIQGECGIAMPAVVDELLAIA